MSNMYFYIELYVEFYLKFALKKQENLKLC
jgi:hypothetical protein